MSAGLIAASAVGAVVALFVLAPLMRTPSAVDDRREARIGRARELLSRRDMLLAALKDLDDDHATDKMSDEDHRELKASLQARALDVLRELDELDIDADDPPQLRLMGRPGDDAASDG